MFGVSFLHNNMTFCVYNNKDIKGHFLRFTKLKGTDLGLK